jgi:hypothetical protein
MSAATPRRDAPGGLAREELGRVVRHEWLRWAREQPDPKPSWLLPWEELTEAEREVDRRIGTALYGLGRSYEFSLWAGTLADQDAGR